LNDGKDGYQPPSQFIAIDTKIIGMNISTQSYSPSEQLVAQLQAIRFELMFNTRAKTGVDFIYKTSIEDEEREAEHNAHASKQMA
jgi:hypothetical protein